VSGADPSRPDALAGPPRQIVYSPEQVALELPLAGPTARMLAYFIDYSIVTLINLVLLVTLVMASPIASWLGDLLGRLQDELGGSDPSAAFESGTFLLLIAFVLVVQLVVEWGYFIFSEMTTGGRSLGKSIVRLRVVGDGGMPLTLRESLGRNLLRAVDMLPVYYLVGLVAMIVSPEAKRLGDLAAGTVVVRMDRPKAAPPIRPADTRDLERFRFSPNEIARLGPDAIRLVRQTLRRIEELDADPAVALCERSAAALATKMEREAVAPGQAESFLRALLHALERR